MNFMNDNDPGLTTGIFTRVDRRTRNSVTVYRLRQTRSGHLIDIEDDGAGPTGPNQKRQRLLKSISDQIEVEGELVPKLHADNSGMGSVDGPGGYPVTIAVVDTAIRFALKAAAVAKSAREAEVKADADFRLSSAALDLEQKKAVEEAMAAIDAKRMAADEVRQSEHDKRMAAIRDNHELEIESAKDKAPKKRRSRKKVEAQIGE